MHLEKLSLINFKNYAEADLEFINGINCFVGDNGVGKTNLLDAVHYLSFSKSFLNPIDSQNMMFDADLFVIQGTFQLKKKKEKVYCGVKKGQKKQFKRNKKEYKKLADHIGLLPVVIISPEDNNLIVEGSEVRRKFIDSIISQLDKVYLMNLIGYNKVLHQRNALLKMFAERGNFDNEALQVWDKQLVDLGVEIYAKRKEFINEFTPEFQQSYDFISGGLENIELEYDSQLNNGAFDKLLDQAQDRDARLRYSSVGIHKDDLQFKIKGHPVKKFGSQGQQKSFVIGLKLAQYNFIKAHKKFTPILLLDDIFDKLDSKRVEKLMKKVSGASHGQIFITHTHQERIKNILDNIEAEHKLFVIDNGVIYQ
ncbi:MAG TPA: DNA replication/repair protein RecF [Flavobacteriales bacterium]|nr:DNA replication/repair protein RecF [Flavobacteriales bacterium]HIA11351.1 DNA replication/repair protein RecF [Flavobacteriales bacterium]